MAATATDLNRRPKGAVVMVRESPSGAKNGSKTVEKLNSQRMSQQVQGPIQAMTPGPKQNFA